MIDGRVDSVDECLESVIGDVEDEEREETATAKSRTRSGAIFAWPMRICGESDTDAEVQRLGVAEQTGSDAEHSVYFTAPYSTHQHDLTPSLPRWSFRVTYNTGCVPVSLHLGTSY